MSTDLNDPSARDRLTANSIELIIRVGVLALLLYWSFILIRPFITIAIWSVVLTVALYPVYEYLVDKIGGRRGLAAILLTIVNLLVVIGPVVWLAISLAETFGMLSERFDLAALALPPPPETIKQWPLVGLPIYQFWELASTNLQAVFAKILPQLKPLGSMFIAIAADAGMGMLKFFIAIIVAGFLFAPAPLLVGAATSIARRLSSGGGESYVQLAGATIRAVSRGVVGVSVLQTLFAGMGLVLAGVPGASLLTSAILILGIIQIGPSIVIVPLIIWSWIAMDTGPALLFTAYMIPVNLMDNALRPLVMGRGLATPTLIIFIGVIGGTISYGITGLFLGPIILAVIWQLAASWFNEQGADRLA